MTQQKNSFRPQVEALDDRTVPAVVLQQPNGVIAIYGTRWNDWARVYNDPFGATIVDTRAATYVFPTWSVTGIRFWGYAGNDIFYNDTGFTCWGYGGAGNDYLYGGWGTDYCYGGWGRDQLYGGFGGYDYLSGGGSSFGIDVVVQDGWGGSSVGVGVWGSSW
jgi:hypothetical protein